MSSETFVKIELHTGKRAVSTELRNGNTSVTNGHCDGNTSVTNGHCDGNTSVTNGHCDGNTSVTNGHCDGNTSVTNGHCDGNTSVTNGHCDGNTHLQNGHREDGNTDSTNKHVALVPDSGARFERVKTCLCRSPPTLQPLASGGGSMCLEFTLPGEAQPFSYDAISESAQFLLSNSRHRPKIGIICGSGLGGLAELLQERNEFPYEEVPNFPSSTVAGHDGKMVLGTLGSVPVVCMKGRFHAYEGYPLWKCAMPVRVMKLMGVEQLIVTNAAGGINPAFSVGDIMVVKDHINMAGFAGDSPLRGRNDERFGPRFPSLNNAYDRDNRALAREIAQEMGLGHALREGVYVMLGGPTYETVAELRLLKLLGADAVGMSTVPEVCVARHCGMKVFAFSLITNACIMTYDTDASANHEEVIETANKRQGDLQELVRRMVARL